MGFDPLPGDVEPGALFVHFGPEVGVGFALPALVEGLDDEVGIAEDCDGVVFEFVGADEFEGLDDGHHFHAVVGGVGVIADDLLCIVAVHYKCGPAAGAWIADATAVCVDSDFLHAGIVAQVLRRLYILIYSALQI